jgi:uncharacterized protein
VRRILLILFGLGLLACTVLFGVGVWQAQQAPAITRYRVTLAGLTRPLKLVQLSDTHAGLDMSADRLSRVVGTINRLRPDVVVLTGDYVSGDPGNWTLAETSDATAPLTDLKAPLGVFAVVGNHDSIEKTRWAMRDTAIRLLVNEVADLGVIVLVGADDLGGARQPVEQMRRLVRAEKGERPVIVLSHRPEFFEWLPPRSELLLAGHTHGGQLLLPKLTRMLVGDYLAGHLRGSFFYRGQLMIVSSGLGTTALPIRWGVPPEIVEIMLVPAGYSVGRKSGTDR